MIDYRRIAEDVRAAVDASGDDAIELLRDSAADFAAAGDEINSRLQRCEDLLRQGYRTEALQECEKKPNLLDAVATLDLPELSAWKEKLAAFGLAEPVPLNVDVAADLNEAYAIDQPLANTLRMHRLHALARSPLIERIAVLGRLQELDPENPIWQDDQKEYEQARLREIVEEVAAAHRAGDLEALDALVEELRDPSRLIKPNTKVTNTVIGTRDKMARRHARSELERLEPALNAAFSAMDADESRRIRSEWQKHIDVARLTEDDALLDRAAPALDWLGRIDDDEQAERTFQSDLDALANALDRKEAPEVLERLADTLARHDREIPTRIVDQYESRMSSHRLSEARRRRLIVAGAGALVFFVAGGIAWLIGSNRYDSAVDNRIALIEKMMDAESLEEARELVEKTREQSRWISRSTRFVELDMSLARLEEQEAQRNTEFHSAVEVAQQSLAAELDDDALAKASKLAKFDEEQRMVAEVESQFASRRRTEQLARDEAFKSSLEPLIKQIAAVEEETQIEAALEQTARLQAELKTLISSAGKINHQLRQNADTLAKKLAGVRRLAMDRQAQQLKLNSITRAVGNWDQFEKQLSRFRDAHRDSTRGAAFDQLLQEDAKIWKSIHRWNGIASSEMRTDLCQLDSQQAARLNETLKEFLADHADHPHVDRIEAAAQFVSAIAARQDASGKAAVNELVRLLNDPLISGLWVLRDTLTGDQYYLNDKPKDTGASVAMEAIVGFDGSTRTIRRLRTHFTDGLVLVERAPHSVLAEGLLDTLAEMNDSRWEETFVAAAERVTADGQIDPIVKILLLQRIVDVASKGSLPLESTLVRHRRMLASPGFDLSVVWIDPENEDARQPRESAAGLLRRLPAWDEALKSALESREKLCQLPASLIWVGWLASDPPGRWQVLGDLPNGAQGTLAIYHGQGEGEPANRFAIGTIKSGSINLRAPTREFAEGCPVFLESL